MVALMDVTNFIYFISYLGKIKLFPYLVIINNATVFFLKSSIVQCTNNKLEKVSTPKPKIRSFLCIPPHHYPLPDSSKETVF